MPLSEGEAVAPPLERGDVALERLAGGILAARVLVALVLAEPVLHVGGGEVDRRHDRAGERLGPLAGVDGPRGEPGLKIVVEDARHADTRPGRACGQDSGGRGQAPTAWPIPRLVRRHATLTGMPATSHGAARTTALPRRRRRAAAASGARAADAERRLHLPRGGERRGGARPAGAAAGDARPERPADAASWTASGCCARSAGAGPTRRSS